MFRTSSAAVSNGLFAAVIVILLIIAGTGYTLYFASRGASSTTTVTTALTSFQTSSISIDTVNALAFEHWAAIGQKNLTATLSQYGPGSVLYWYVKGSALNGTYTNQTAISKTWQAFFSHTNTVYYVITDYSVSLSGSSAKVTAVLWYLLGNATVTLKLPYELDYSYANGHWTLVGDWWGLPNNPGITMRGVSWPGYTATTSSSTSSYSYGYGYG